MPSLSLTHRPNGPHHRAPAFLQQQTKAQTQAWKVGCPASALYLQLFCELQSQCLIDAAVPEIQVSVSRFDHVSTGQRMANARCNKEMLLDLLGRVQPREKLLTPLLWTPGYVPSAPGFP
eukprot:3760073-Rhodomonas_salina.4